MFESSFNFSRYANMSNKGVRLIYKAHLSCVLQSPVTPKQLHLFVVVLFKKKGIWYDPDFFRPQFLPILLPLPSAS